MYKFGIYPKAFTVNGQDIGVPISITETSYDIHMALRGREHISIYAFSRFMLAPRWKKSGEEKVVYNKEEYFLFTGPRLGMYSDTADIREGPFVNHYINKLEVLVTYKDSQFFLELNGEADLSCSSIDDYWYKGKKEGIWSFSGLIVFEDSE